MNNNRQKRIYSAMVFTMLLVVGMFLLGSSAVHAAAARCMDEKQCNDYIEKLNQGRSGSAARASWSPSSECENNLGYCSVSTAGIKLGVAIPGQGSTVSGIAEYINIVFRFLLGAAGIVAATMLVWGGYVYLTAAGNQARVSQAKDIITSSIIGLALLLGSTLGLSFINDRLVQQNNINVPLIIPQNADLNIGFCTGNTPTVTCGEITTVDGNSCRSKDCTSAGGGICLPFMISEINGVNGYKCYPNTVGSIATEADAACANAPADQCDLVTPFVRTAHLPEEWECGGRSGVGCSAGRKLDCPSATYRLSCASCGGYEIGDDESTPVGNDVYYCSDPGTVTTDWHKPGFIGDSWSSVCCESRTAAGVSTFRWLLYRDGGQCKIKSDGANPDGSPKYILDGYCEEV